MCDKIYIHGYFSKRSLAVVVLLFSYLVISSPVSSNESAQNENKDKSLKELYTRKGADTCLKCHDEDYKYSVYPIFYSKHGNRQDPRTPMAQLQCESCHGPGRAHATEPNVGKERAPIIAFGHQSKFSVEDQNRQCLNCHNDANRQNWPGSIHALQDMLCVDCHTLHVREDPLVNGDKQAETCFRCHKKQQAEFSQPSVHPVRQGRMKCSQCHNPHGSFSNALLKTSTKNETCYHCHAEKRGPFLWPHAPVMEDCTICHEQHGSIHKALLKKRVPYLCQQCHSQAGHPSFSNDSSALSSAVNNKFVLAKGCLNCHFQIHGSNHPSGVKLMR